MATGRRGHHEEIRTACRIRPRHDGRHARRRTDGRYHVRAEYGTHQRPRTGSDLGAEHRSQCRVRRYGHPGHRRHRAAPVAAVAGRADRGQRLLRRQHRKAADRQPDRAATVAAQHHLHENGLYDLQLHDPRHRRPVRRRNVRSGDGDPRQRHAARDHPPVRKRILRPRTRRSAARAAGHAVRPQRDVGRRQLHHRQARSQRRPCRGRIRIWQLRFEAREGDVQPADHRHARHPRRRHVSEARRLYLQHVRQQPHRRSRSVCDPRYAVVGAVVRHAHRPDGLLFPRKGQSQPHPEAAVPSRSDRRARLSARYQEL